MIMTGMLTLAGGVYMGAKAFGLLPTQQKDKLKAIATKPMTMLTAPSAETDEIDKPLTVVEEAAEMTPEEERKLLDHFFKVSSGVLGVSAVTLATVPAAHVIVIPALL